QNFLDDVRTGVRVDPDAHHSVCTAGKYSSSANMNDPGRGLAPAARSPRTDPYLLDRCGGVGLAALAAFAGPCLLAVRLRAAPERRNAAAALAERRFDGLCVHFDRPLESRAVLET